MLFFLNLIALGGGPPFTGWVIDQFAQFNFNNGPGHGVLASIGQMLGGTGGAENFAKACPGGLAPEGSATGLVARCQDSLVDATRSGVIVSLCFYMWAAFHYLLGSFGLVKALADARKARGEA